MAVQRTNGGICDRCGADADYVELTFGKTEFLCEACYSGARGGEVDLSTGENKYRSKPQIMNVAPVPIREHGPTIRVKPRPSPHDVLKHEAIEFRKEEECAADIIRRKHKDARS